MSRTGAPALTTPQPIAVRDLGHHHDGSVPWERDKCGRLHATGFNGGLTPRANHACVDATYELEQPGAIGYRWRVDGSDAQGREIFDSYWYLKGSDGSLRSGADFLGETDGYNLRLIDGLEAGTYQLTLGVFCLGREGAVSLDLAPCA